MEFSLQQLLQLSPDTTRDLDHWGLQAKRGTQDPEELIYELMLYTSIPWGENYGEVYNYQHYIYFDDNFEIITYLAQDRSGLGARWLIEATYQEIPHDWGWSVLASGWGYEVTTKWRTYLRRKMTEYKKSQEYRYTRNFIKQQAAMNS